MTIAVWARWLSRVPSSMSRSAKVCCSSRVAESSMSRIARGHDVGGQPREVSEEFSVGADHWLIRCRGRRAPG